MRSRNEADNRDRATEGIAHDRPGTGDSTLSELEVLQAISRAFGSSADLREAAVAAVRWVRAAVADEDAGVRIFVSRPDGQLVPALPRIEAADEPERLAERRRVLESRRPARAPLAEGRVLVTIPLLSRGEQVGVLEVTARQAAVEDPARLRLVSALGLGRGRGPRLRSRMRLVRHADLIHEEGRAEAAAAFA